MRLGSGDVNRLYAALAERPRGDAVASFAAWRG